MQKILLSAFACNPIKGSEPANGWNWARELTKKGYQVHCFTREVGKKDIESMEPMVNLTFHYLKLPWGLESLYSRSQATMYVYYILWQWFLYKEAKSWHKKITFDVAHHVSWANIQLGSFLYKLEIPFIFGPLGGGQLAPEIFSKYFGQNWAGEVKRKKISFLLQRFNPACRNAIKKAKVVLISNEDTLNLAKKLGAKQVELMLAATIADSFFPPARPERERDKKALTLLWVGRFLPRKGILLVLEVMALLKDYPDITLTVVGDGPTQPEFLSAIERLSLQNINWVGKVPYEKVKEFYATHDAFLFTSFRDSGPAQLVEAMAYGLPVITIDIHGQAQIVQSGITGIKCNTETVEIAIKELRKAVLILYNDRQKLEDYSRNAFTFSQQQRFPRVVEHVTSRYY